MGPKNLFNLDDFSNYNFSNFEFELHDFYSMFLFNKNDSK